jgi:hypothetical protein
MARLRSPSTYRLGDLDPGARLFGSCDHCQHVAHLDRVTLQRRLGVSFMLAMIARRLRCGRCRAVRVRLLLVAGTWARWYRPEDA